MIILVCCVEERAHVCGMSGLGGALNITGLTVDGPGDERTEVSNFELAMIRLGTERAVEREGFKASHGASTPPGCEARRQQCDVAVPQD